MDSTPAPIVGGMDIQARKYDSLRPNFKIKVSDLTEEILKMAKSPNIDADLSGVLDKFLVRLQECEQYLQNGIFSMNFAEAALLLQSSADVYGKKVDLLWDAIFEFQKRMISEENGENKAIEMEKLEERKRKYKRKRKTNSDEHQAKKLISSFSFGNADKTDYLGENFEPNSLSEEWEKFQIQENDNSIQLDVSKSSVFLPNTSVYTEEYDYLGRYDQFHSVSLIEEIFQLEDNNLIEDKSNCVSQMRVDSYLTNDFLFNKSISSDKSQESYVNDLNQYLQDFMDSSAREKENARIVTQEIRCKEIYVNLERLPTSVLREKLRRQSEVDSLFDASCFDDDNLSSISENCHNNDFGNESIVDNSQSEIVDDLGKSLDNRNKSCSQDSAFYEGDEDMEDSSRINTPAAFLSTTPLPESQTPHRRSVTPFPCTPSSSTPAPVACSTPFSKKTEATDIQLCCGNSRVIPKVVKLKTKEVKEKKTKEDFKKPKAPKRRKLSEKMILMLSTGVTANFREFEKFFRLHYQSEENEGKVPTTFSDLDSDSDSENEDDDPTLNDLSGGEEVIEDTTLVNEEEVIEDTTLNNEDEVISQPTALPDNFPQEDPEISQINFDNQKKRPPERPREFCNTEFELEEESRRNIREWNNFIMPKLKAIEKEPKFDIHEYGSKILDPLEIGEGKLFSEFVEGGSSKDVSRFFMAALQLANTSNIEISGGVPGELANDTLKFTVLDKTRHHEMLEGYTAPSEETFQERLQKARSSIKRAKVPVVVLHSLDFPNKKMKLSENS